MSVNGDLGECARTLVQAVFRLAFCDYIGIAYGHDEPGPDKWIRLNAAWQPDAEKFLTSVWGAHLADLAGMTANMIWKQAQRDLLHRRARLLVKLEGPKSDPDVSAPALDPGLVGVHAEVRRAA
jgi:hypothetical protein